MESQQTGHSSSGSVTPPSGSSTTVSTSAVSQNRRRKFWPTLFRIRTIVDRPYMLVIGGVKYRQYTMKLHHLCGRRSEFVFHRIPESPHKIIHVMDGSQDVVMTLTMDLGKQEFTLADLRNGRDFRFSRVRKFFVFSRIQSSGDEIPLAQIVPRNCATKADVKWIRPSHLYGDVVAQLSRPLINRQRFKYGVDSMRVWFDPAVDEMVAVGLQVCFMCVRRMVNPTHL